MRGSGSPGRSPRRGPARETAWSGSASPLVTAVAMSSAIFVISSVPIPCVVVHGVPTRMPEAMLAFCGSNGIAFLLRTIPAASARASASTPVTPTPWRSCSDRWVSVPPVVGPDAVLPERGGQLPGVLDDPAGVLRVLRRRALLEVHRLGGDGVHLRAALHHREDRAVERRGVLGLGHQGAGARPAQHLVRREGDDVGIRDRAGDRLAGDETDEVRGVDPEDRADLVGEVAEELEVDEPRDRAAAGAGSPWAGARGRARRPGRSRCPRSDGRRRSARR